VTDSVKILFGFKNSGEEGCGVQVRLDLMRLGIHPNEYDLRSWEPGCFGAMSLITHSFVKSLLERFNFEKLDIDSRLKRESFERVFTITCCTVLGKHPEFLLHRNIAEYQPWGVSLEMYQFNIQIFQELPVVKLWSGR
jgi:hypothetical protein